MTIPPGHPHAALAERYRIERELGRGGMAVVYLAHDLKRDRTVALKVLRPELAALLGPKRFLREIQITGELTHPHIQPLHEAGELHGVLYYTMPYVEGGSLRERLEREKQLAVGDAVAIATALALALDHAHRTGVVHRDLTPENILLKDGHAMVADFGVAKAINEAGGEALTLSGHMMGTPGYMSPEQASGAEADGRTDLYALGCVLYEMLAGQPPFTGPTWESVMHQHASVEPRPVTDLRPSIPVPLAQVVTRLLAKAPADRIGNGAEVARALEAAVATPTAVAEARAADKRRKRVNLRWMVAGVLGILMLAVAAAWRLDWLPWVGPQPPAPTKRARIVVAEFDAPDSVLGVVVRDLVSTAMDQSRIARALTSDEAREALVSMGRSPDSKLTAAVARELASRTRLLMGGSMDLPVVEGKVAQMGQGYLVTIRATKDEGSQVLASLSERAQNKDELIDAANRIGRKLRRSLGEKRAAIEETASLGFLYTSSFDAFEIMVGAWSPFMKGDYQTALEMYRQATVLDPNFSGAYAHMGLCHLNSGDRDSAAFYYRKALANRGPGRLEASGRVLFEAGAAKLEGDYVGAAAVLGNGIAQWPNSPSFHNNRATLLLDMGRTEEAVAHLRKAIALGEVGIPPLCAALLALNRVEEAEEWATKLRGSTARRIEIWIALAASRWSRAESLGVLRLEDPAAVARLRAVAGSAAAASRAARGAMGGARDALTRTLSTPKLRPVWAHEGLRHWLLLDLLTGSPQAPPFAPDARDTSTMWLGYRAVREAAFGDTVEARALMRRLERRSTKWEARADGLLAGGLIDWRAGQWQRLLGHSSVARTSLYEDRIPRECFVHAMRWLMADAWEHLGHPDSAAVYVELATNTVGWKEIVPWAITKPFAHQRLVLLYAQMGRWQEARTHWEILNALATQADDAFRPRLAEARQAMAGAERIGMVTPP